MGKKNIKNKNKNNTNVNYEVIDYEKLSNSILIALRQNKKEDELNQIELQKNKVQRTENNKSILWKMITIKQNEIDNQDIIYSLFRECNALLMGLFEFVFYILTIVALYFAFFKNAIIKWPAWIAIAFFMFVIAKTIRIAKLGAKKATNKKQIVETLNILIAFSAVILSTVSIIVSVILYKVH